MDNIPYNKLFELMNSELIKALENLLNIEEEYPSIKAFLLTTSIVDCKLDTSGMMEQVSTYKLRKNTAESIFKKAVGNKDIMKVLKSIPLELLKELCTLKDASDTSVALDDLQDRLKNNCVIFEETETK